MPIYCGRGLQCIVPDDNIYTLFRRNAVRREDTIANISSYLKYKREKKYGLVLLVCLLNDDAQEVFTGTLFLVQLQAARNLLRHHTKNKDIQSDKVVIYELPFTKLKPFLKYVQY